MHSLRSHVLRNAFVQNPCLKHARCASLTSAIGRGIRKGANTLDRIGTTRRDTKKDFDPRKVAKTDYKPRKDVEKNYEPRKDVKKEYDSRRNARKEYDPQMNARKDYEPRTRNTPLPRSRHDIERATQPSQPPRRQWDNRREAQDRTSHEAPQGVPYTVAGSEFLYGTFAVKAAIEAKRRQLYKLYIWRGERNPGDEHDKSIAKLAKSNRIKVQEVAGSWDRMMMRMSGQRPHNGYVLEASSIPKLPIGSLESMETPSDPLSVTVLPQSLEDQLANQTFKVEGLTASIPRAQERRRYPLLLWLDRVTDTGNLGAIIRTASFFGADGIIIPEHGTAPFSPITVKASAGTAEYMPILTVKRESDFVKSSQQKGWKFFAAVAPASESTRRRSENMKASNVSEALDESPCVLMLGNEGEGLRSFLQKAADEPISIQGADSKTSIVDSLNVSVAAALLMARFLEPPKTSSSTISISSRQAQSAAEGDPEAMF